MNTKTPNKNTRFYIRFTLLFLVTALVIYAPFLVLKKSFVWEHDSYTQHIKAMIFISRWYRQSFKALLTGNWKAISTYSFSLGYGSDALTTLAYYGVGDPFYLFSALVPAKYIYLFYCALIPVKNYFSGIAFAALCRFRWPSAEHEDGCLAGSLIFTFCGFALITCIGQPIFLNALIIFPLVLLGIEKVREGQKPWLFIFSVCLATVANFYFIVSIVLMAVLYALFRYFPIAKGEIGRRFKEIGVMFAAGTVGVAMGGVILLPMALTVLSNKRVGMKPAIDLFYEIRTCRMLPVDFLACNEVEYGALCYAGTALLCVFLLFSTKGYLKLRLQFLLYSALLFIPAFGYVTNGFSYPIDRWCWAYSALVGMLVAEMWPGLFTLNEHQKRVMTTGLTVYFVVCCFLAYELDFTFLGPASFTFLTLLHLLRSQKELFEAAVPGREGTEATAIKASAVGAAGTEVTGTGATETEEAAAEIAAEETAGAKKAARKAARRPNGFRRAQRWVLVLTIVSVCINGISKNYPDFQNRIKTYKDMDSLAAFRTGMGASPANDRNMWLNDTSQIASAIGHDTTKFVRVSNTEPGYWYQNTSILNGLSTTQSFWSVNNPYILECLEALGVSDVNNNAWQFTFLDNRAILNELASVSYLYCLHPEKLPAGYSETSLDQNTANAVYANLNPLSLGYTYDKTVSREKFDQLTPAQRQELLLSYAVTESNNVLATAGSAEELAGKLECRNVPFRVSCLSAEIVQTDANTFVVTKGGAKAELSFDPVGEGECYLFMKNIQFRETGDLELYSDDLSYDPDNLYTQEMLDKKSNYEKYWLFKDVLESSPLTNIKIKAAFMSSGKKVTENGVNYILPGDEQFYSGRQDFLLNSYTITKELTSIVVTFPAAGIYHFDEFSVISEPLASYKSKVAALSAESLEKVEISQNASSFVSPRVTGEITVSGNKLLCLTIPYSEGWKAYVDGTPVTLEKVNIMFSGLWLTSGQHTIELRYETPGLFYGWCLTAAGILLFLLWVVLAHRAGKPKMTEV